MFPISFPFRLLPAGAWLVRSFAAVFVATVLLGYALHAGERTPDEPSPLVTREVRDTLRAAGETTGRAIPAIHRRWTDYYRATHGVLVATDRRLLYIGETPPPLVAPMSDDEPAVGTEQLSLDYDDASVSEARGVVSRSRGILVRTARGREFFEVPDHSWPEARRLLLAVARRQADLREAAARERRARAEAEARARLPLYYTIARGDALESIARRFGTTVERLREMNGLTNDRIRVRDSLLVRPGK